MKHRIAAAVTAMAIGAVSASAYDVKVDGIYYNIIDGEYLEVTSVIPHDGVFLCSEYPITPTLCVLKDIVDPPEEYFSYCGDVVIPDSVKIDGYNAKLPVQTIGHHAFYLEKKLESVTLPTTIRNIGEGAFALSSVEKLDMGSADLPYVGDWMCYYCENLSELIFPQNLENIGLGSFMGLGEKIKSLTMPATLKTIGRQAFCHSYIEDVRGLENVTSFGAYCFFDTEFQTILIRDVLTVLESRAFMSQLSLRNVISLKPDPEAFASDVAMQSVFYGSNPECTLWVPDESLELYKASERWTSFFKNIRPLSQVGIESAAVADGEAAPELFDLMGRRIAAPVPGRIYVGSDGRKVRY